MVSGRHQRLRAACQRSCIVTIQLDRPRVIFDRPMVITFLLAGEAPVEVDRVGIGINRCRCGKVRYGEIVVPILNVGDSSVVICDPVPRVDPNRLGEGGNALLERRPPAT